PIKSKPVMSKPAPPPRPVQKPITPVRVQPKPVQPTPPVQVQPVSKPVQPTPQVQKPESRPFFVLKRGYHILLDSIREVDVRIDTVQPTIDFLIKNKNKQDVKFEEMRIVLEDIERKLLYVDKTMFER
ncbi:hypothetical protein HN592_00250, partial [Candidatus Woesearchaeota archaeon]|nr:hypothetical protein [Candidatus Woesearchaeota archaeon]